MERMQSAEWQSPGQIAHSQDVGDWKESDWGLLPAGCSTDPPLCGQHLYPKPLYAQCKSPSAPQGVGQFLNWALVAWCLLVSICSLHPWQASMKEGHGRGIRLEEKPESLPSNTPNPPTLGLQTCWEVYRADKRGGVKAVVFKYKPHLGFPGGVSGKEPAC